MTTTYAPIGSVSTGTMRNEDLIPCFMNVLKHLDKDQHDVIVADYKYNDKFDYESEDADYLINEDLLDALNNCAAPYCYFGSHEGDGTDYGFWVSWDSIEDACRIGEILKVNAGDEWPNPLPEETEYVLEVTDHDNGTLHTITGEEIWSVV